MQKNPYASPLGQLVSSYQQLVVDDYQRTYQWEKEQIDDLFSDIEDTRSSGGTHFFGTLILQQSGDDAVTIVDGQQRITSIFLVVAKLRDEILSLGIKELGSESSDRMPINVISKARNFLYFADSYSSGRLTPNRFIRKLFEEHVLAEGGNKKPLPARDRRSTLAFRKASQQISSNVDLLLNGIEGNERLARINQLLDVIIERFTVLKVVTGSLSESLEIFLTLNNRGQPLGPSDLVRGEILAARGLDATEPEQQQLQEKVNLEWEDVLERVREPETFLRHYLVARTGEKVQKKKVIDHVQAEITGSSAEKRKRATEFWKDLLLASETYAAIVKPEMGGTIQELLELVGPLSKSQRIVLLVAFKNIKDEKKLEEVVRLVVALAFRWVVHGGNAQRLEDFFQELCKNKGDENFATVLIASLQKKLKSFGVDPRQYFETDADASYVTRALLYAINQVTSAGAQPIAKSPDEINLEHIAPRSHTDHWLGELDTADDPDEYSRLVSSAGNLTLLDKKLNISTRQKPFANKISEEYVKSVVHITRDLKELDNWNRSMIEKRTEWLAEMFSVVWPDGSKSSGSVKSFSEWRYQQEKNPQSAT